MAYCKKCGVETRNYRDLCYDCEPKATVGTKTLKDKLPYFILGFLFPIVGIPLAIIWWKDFDKSPKSILLGAFISTFLWIAWFVLLVVLSVMAELGTLDDYIPEPLPEQVEVYEDAIMIEEAARLYCDEIDCGNISMIRFTDLENKLDGFDTSKYDLEEHGGIVVYYDKGVYKISLERTGTGNYEFPFGQATGLVTAYDMEIDED